MLLGVIGLTIAGGIWLFSKPPATPEGPSPTAVVWTATPTPLPTATPDPTPAPTSVAPGQIGVGARVSVIGTGGVGLSIRSEAGTTAERLVVAAEGDTLVIVEGPTEAEGYIWWFVRDELDPQHEGWVVQDYLLLAD